MLYEYRAIVLKIQDGDSYTMDVDLGDDIHAKWKLRLAGVNCHKDTTAEGKASTQFVERWFAKRRGEVMIRTIKDKREKYGRMLVRVWDDATGECLNQLVLDAKHGDPYDGTGPRS